MLQRPTPRLMLASASESRRALLAAAGLTFEVRPADIDEAAIKSTARAEGIEAGAAALRLAYAKAAAVAQHVPDALVIGADQILVSDGAWFDKPADAAGAREQLRALRGRPHVLATATVCRMGVARIWHDIATPRLIMRDFSEVFLDCYLAREAATVASTVGAYRLEGLGIQLFTAIDGDHSAILGLPLLPLLAYLRQAGVIIE